MFGKEQFLHGIALKGTVSILESVQSRCLESKLENPE
jgi:hypothetical protein